MWGIKNCDFSALRRYLRIFSKPNASDKPNYSTKSIMLYTARCVAYCLGDLVSIVA